MEKYKDYSQIIVDSLEEIASEVFVLSFKRTFHFIPGQVIGITDKKEVPARMYSIASGNTDENVRILFDVKLGGHLTPRMADLKAGDKLYITQPYGSFTCDESPAYWIAAGTGIAPFISIFSSGNKTEKTLIHGARFTDSFYFSEHFEPALKERYIRCCSGENKGPFFKGRVTTYLSQQSNLPHNQKYYLCGRAEMVVETRDLLISKGIPYENIMAEIYF